MKHVQQYSCQPQKPEPCKPNRTIKDVHESKHGTRSNGAAHQDLQTGIVVIRVGKINHLFSLCCNRHRGCCKICFLLQRQWTEQLTKVMTNKKTHSYNVSLFNWFISKYLHKKCSSLFLMFIYFICTCNEKLNLKSVLVSIGKHFLKIPKSIDHLPLVEPPRLSPSMTHQV